MTLETNNQENIKNIGVNTPFDQDIHDFAYVVPGEPSRDDDNVRHITSAPSFHGKKGSGMPDYEMIEVDQADPRGMNRLSVAQKASKLLLGGSIDRTPKSTAVAAAKRRQFVTEQTRKLSDRGY
jgi:hypothetical protein